MFSQPSSRSEPFRRRLSSSAHYSSLAHPNRLQRNAFGAGLNHADIKDLNKCSIDELLELRDKHRTLLQNPSLLAQLPDNGERVRQANERIEVLLGRTDHVNEVGGVLGNLDIGRTPSSTTEHPLPQEKLQAYHKLKSHIEREERSISHSQRNESRYYKSARLQPISLAESMKLQEENWSQIENEYQRIKLSKLSLQGDSDKVNMRSSNLGGDVGEDGDDTWEQEEEEEEDDDDDGDEESASDDEEEVDVEYVGTTC
ncbi:uncharacterized protein VTP21DRAFT_5893 [Calcarisporiella thermophila]|uniref:uncharacterized protein n=1 Tax=Calcarisporiella thermophila TaxID=911321 RepID=UPI00374463F0